MSLKESKQGKSAATAVSICWKRPEKRSFRCRCGGAHAQYPQRGTGTNQAVREGGIKKQLL